MPASVGRKIVVRWKGEIISASAREKSIAFNGEPIDVTTDGDQGWRTLLAEAAQNQMDLTVSGVTKSNALRNDWLSRASDPEACQGDLEVTYANGDVVSCLANLVGLTDTGPYNEGSTYEASFQSASELDVQLDSAPINSVLPAVSGVPTVGQILTALEGVWVGATSYTYVWERDGAPISNATAKTYTLAEADEGHSITVSVTGINAEGQLVKESAPLIVPGD